MNIVTIFDLDGVLIDNVAYEHAVTEDIIRKVGESQNVSFETAFAKWNKVLEEHRQCPRWHDYSLHCRSLGVPDAWQESHLAMRNLLRPMPQAIEALGIGHQIGACWLASDATRWVVEFKLSVTEISVEQFNEIFTLDSFGVNKGCDLYWNRVAERVEGDNTAIIFIDNRLDRLLSALKVLPNCNLILVDSEDHPMSLRIFDQPSYRAIPLHHAAKYELPDVLRKVSLELGV